MGKWEVKNLSNLFEIKSSKRVLKSDWKTEGIPFYRAREVVKLAQNGFVNNELFISEELYDQYTKDRGFPKEDDIIISSVGTLGQCYLVKKSDKFYFKDASVLWFEKKSDTDSRFIEYAFKTRLIKNQINKKSSGATVGTLTISTARNLKIPLPPLAEQQRIVAKLDGLFAKIDKALSLLEANIEHTQALMGSVLDEELSNLEEICLKVKVKDVVKLSRGHNPPKKDFIYEPKEDYVRFLQIRDGTSDKNACYVPITKKLHLVTKNDLLLVAYRHVGKVFRNMEGAFNVALCKLENLDESKLNMTYMFYLVQSKYIKGELLKRSERALIPSMSVDHLKSLKIPFPDIKKQNKLALKFENVSKLSKKLIKIQTKKLNHLKALKSSLLDQAFKGEL